MVFLKLLIVILIKNVYMKYCKNNQFTLEISDGHKIIESQQIVYNQTIVFEKNNYFYKDGNIYGCICDVRICYRKCCPVGSIYGQNKTCVPDTEQVFKRSAHNELKDAWFLVKPLDCPGTKYALYTNEVIFAKNGSVATLDHEHFDNYCLEILTDDSFRLNTILCEESTPEIGIGFKTEIVISILFLVLTLVVYLILPELQNLFGKSLMIFLVALILAKLLLFISKLNFVLSDLSCVSLAYGLYFFFLATFFWMNVLSFDIWRNLCGYRNFFQQKQSACRLFFFYNLYGWLMPSLITMSIFFLETNTDVLKNWIRPEFGSEKCFFKDEQSLEYYFHYPLTIIFLANFIFFILCAISIYEIKKNTANLILHNRKYEGFVICIKLVFVMGLIWVSEIWPSDFDNNFLSKILQTLSGSFGVLIFLIFICKKNILFLLRRRFNYKSVEYHQDIELN